MGALETLLAALAGSPEVRPGTGPAMVAEALNEAVAGQAPAPEIQPIAYVKRITDAELLFADAAERRRAAEWPWDMWCRICLIRPSSFRTEEHAREGADQHVALYHVTQAEAHAYLAAVAAGRTAVPEPVVATAREHWNTYWDRVSERWLPVRTSTGQVPAPHEDPALPPRLREALRIMGRRGPVVELTAPDAVPGTPDLTARIYDAIAEFNSTACWPVLQLAQMRQYLAEHLAAALTAPGGKDTRDAGQAPAGESTQPHPVLGEFIGCTRSTCNRGEWSAKASGRGWEHAPETGQWLCPQCAADAEDRRDFLARTDAEQGGDHS